LISANDQIESAQRRELGGMSKHLDPVRDTAFAENRKARARRGPSFSLPF
jgi:hypothetical protein